MVECSRCGRRYADDSSDGYRFRDGWVCAECGYCPKCGRSLENEPEKMGGKNAKAGLCRLCQLWVDEFGPRLFIRRPRRKPGRPRHPT